METTLPIRAEEVLQSTDIRDLGKKCKELRIPYKDCSTVQLLQERIINHVREVYGKTTKAVSPVNFIHECWYLMY